jgi:serine/threonine-protein kinase HipA
MAMAVEEKNRHYLWDGIHARHWIEMARRCGIAGMEVIIADVVSRTPAVIDRVQAAIPKGFPALIADTILAGVRASSERLKTELTKITKT